MDVVHYVHLQKQYGINLFTRKADEDNDINDSIVQPSGNQNVSSSGYDDKYVTVGRNREEQTMATTIASMTAYS